MISVIVPVYNVEKYLRRCIVSLINQTYKDLEIILVDDGSTDRSGILCDELAKEDERIKVIHKENGGLSDARNKGIEVATGDYLGFVDSDDWIEANMYHDLINALEREGAEVAVTGINRIYDNGYKVSQFIYNRPFLLTEDNIVQSYLRQGVFSTAVCDKLFTKKIFYLLKFPVGKHFEDAPVVFNLICKIKKMVIVGKPQYNYFQRKNSITGNPFSQSSMDHYFFSKEIREIVLEKYPKFKKDVDIFWSCKLIELLYSLYESSNYLNFKTEEGKIKSDFKKVKWKILRCKEVPTVMKVKAVLLILHMASMYNKTKKIITRKQGN